MRKFIDITMIIAGSFLFLGCMVFLTAYFLYFSSDDAPSAKASYEMSMEDGAEVSSIIIDVAVCDIKFVPSDRFMITGKDLSTYEDDPDSVILDVKLDGGVLSIKQATNHDFDLFDSRFGFEKGYIGSEHPEITVYYPEDTVYETISITDGSGKVALGDITCSRLNSKVFLGSVIAEGDVYAENISITVSVGKIDLDIVSAERVKISNNIGVADVNVDDAESAYGVISDTFIGYLSAFNDNSYFFVNNSSKSISSGKQVSISGTLSFIKVY